MTKKSFYNYKVDTNSNAIVDYYTDNNQYILSHTGKINDAIITDNKEKNKQYTLVKKSDNKYNNDFYNIVNFIHSNCTGLYLSVKGLDGKPYAGKQFSLMINDAAKLYKLDDNGIIFFIDLDSTAKYSIIEDNNTKYVFPLKISDGKFSKIDLNLSKKKKK